MPGRRKTRLKALGTEQSNPAAHNLDRKSALEIVRLINSEDAKVAGAVRKALPQVARAAETITASLARGGRLIYVGTGTSGRLGALDAIECAPTFAVHPQSVQFLLAGGNRALASAVESNEDSAQAGRHEMSLRHPGARDVVVGISASGRTPYTIAALQYAKSKGAATIALTCNRKSGLERAAGIAIVVDVGPEVVAGSSRMKAGTAQKMVLNMMSTAAMARLGFVLDNLMVNVHLNNRKLSQRGLNIVARAAGVSEARARTALRRAGSVPVAVIMLKARIGRVEAERRLRMAGGNVRQALGQP